MRLERVGRDGEQSQCSSGIGNRCRSARSGEEDLWGEFVGSDCHSGMHLSSSGLNAQLSEGREVQLSG